MSCTWRGQPLYYFDHPYNDTRRNERAVELAVVQTWLADVAGYGLEVGNVLSHYVDAMTVPPRRIVDRFETGPGVENVDVLDVIGRFDWIVSVSTLEHVGVDDGSLRPWAARAAVQHLRDLLSPGGRMLVTVPWGYNAWLDAALYEDDVQVTESAAYLRVGDDCWDDITLDDAQPYGSIAPGWAATVWIGEWRA